MPLRCRYYAQKYPVTDDVVMVNVRSITEMEAYVDLLEYNNIQGRILLSDLSKQCIGSDKLICLGETEPVVVIRVDKEKGYVELSKQRFSPKEKEKYTEKYSKATEVNLILRYVADFMGYKTDEEFEDLYKKTAWHFEEKLKKQSSSASFANDIFKQAVNDPSLLEECGLDETTKKTLLRIIRRKLGPPPVTIRAEIEVACNYYKGNEDVEIALIAGMSYSTEDTPITINSIAPPLYVMTTETREPQDGFKALEDAIETIQEYIKSFGGVCKVQMEPKKVVTEIDEWEELVKAALENAEIGGDDGQSDMEAEGSEEGIEVKIKRILRDIRRTEDLLSTE